MAYGVLWTPEHIDVTNYYLRMGVDGGLPLMLTFIATLAVGFAMAGAARHAHEDDRAYRFLPWALGVSLLAHTAAFVSVSYFDQTVVFLALTLAAIGGTRADDALDPVDRPTTGLLDSPTRLARL
jgi:hypothetical protein